MEYISPEGLRQDGRRPQELRQLKCELGVLDKGDVDGSASFEMGNTKVIAAVYGPNPDTRRRSVTASLVARGRLVCRVHLAAFSTSGDRIKRPRVDRRSLEIAAAVQDTLEETILTDQLQRTEILIILEVLQADGGEKAACINAAILALANAGVPVQDLAAACTVGYLDATPLVDLNFSEVSGRGPQATLAYQVNLDRIALLEVFGGSLRTEVLEDLCLLAQEGSKAIAQFMRNNLMSHAERLVKCQGITMF